MSDRDRGAPAAGDHRRRLDLYAGQLERCLKALGTDAPIRADVQRELAAVRAEQDARAGAGEHRARRNRSPGRAS